MQQLVDGMNHKSIARGPDRVTDSDAAAVDVDDVVGKSEFCLRARNHGTERFVDLGLLHG